MSLSSEMCLQMVTQVLHLKRKRGGGDSEVHSTTLNLKGPHSRGLMPTGRSQEIHRNWRGLCGDRRQAVVGKGRAEQRKEECFKSTGLYFLNPAASSALISFCTTVGAVLTRSSLLSATKASLKMAVPFQ